MLFLPVSVVGMNFVSIGTIPIILQFLIYLQSKIKTDFSGNSGILTPIRMTYDLSIKDATPTNNSMKT